MIFLFENLFFYNFDRPKVMDPLKYVCFIRREIGGYTETRSTERDEIIFERGREQFDFKNWLFAVTTEDKQLLPGNRERKKDDDIRVDFSPVYL